MAILDRARQLIVLTRKEFSAAYRGSYLGTFWQILSPLLFMIFFTFFFATILGVKWGGVDTSSELDFALNLLIGLIVFWFFAEIFNESSQLFLRYSYLVKSTQFPLWLLPIALVISSFFKFLIGFLVWCSIFGSVHDLLRAVSLYLILIFMAMLIVGSVFALIISAFSVFLRDLPIMIRTVTPALMFVSGVFFQADQLPASIAWSATINPIFVFIELLRDQMFNAETVIPRSFSFWAGFLSGSIGLATLGYLVFERLRPGFSDEL